MSEQQSMSAGMGDYKEDLAGSSISDIAILLRKWATVLRLPSGDFINGDFINDDLRLAATELDRLRAEVTDKSNQIAELQEQISHLYGIEQSRDAAEARAEKAEAERDRFKNSVPFEVLALEAQLAALREVTEDLLDHYLGCYEGNEDELVLKTRAALATAAETG